MVQQTSPQLLPLFDHFRQSSSVAYPPYYLRPFHAYPLGNLEWLAAYEAAPATLSVAMRAWRDDTLTPHEAHAKLRGRILQLLRDYLSQQHGEVRRIADLGTSGGSFSHTCHGIASGAQGVVWV